MGNDKDRILKALNFRHACKEFDENKKISEEDFNFILETARLSPSSFGFEPWKFLIIENQELKEKIGSVSWGAQRQLPGASHFVVILARKKKDMIYGSEYVSYMLEDVHHLPDDARTMRGNRYENFQKNDQKLLESDKALFDWACKQTYIAMANMLTAAAGIGIDSCPIEGFDRDKLEHVLIESGVLDIEKFGVSVMVAFGYRKSEPRPKTRQRMDDIVEWIK